MQFTKRKKIFILVGMFALLAVTGYLNFALNNGGTEAGSKTQSSASFFTTFHNQRADERSASIAILTSMSAEDSGYSAAIRESSAKQLMTLLATIQYENTVENLIILQNYEDAICIMTNDNINVIVKKDATIEEQGNLWPSIYKIIRDNYSETTFGEFDIEKVSLNFMA